MIRLPQMPTEEGIDDRLDVPTSPEQLSPAIPDNDVSAVVPLIQRQKTPTDSRSVNAMARLLLHDNTDILTSYLCTSNMPDVRAPDATGTTVSIDADSSCEDVRRECLDTPTVDPAVFQSHKKDEKVMPDILKNVIHQLQLEAKILVDDD